MQIRSELGVQTPDVADSTARFAHDRVRDRPEWSRDYGLVGQMQELARFWPVIWNLVSQELRVRYQRSVVGFAWTLLNPILMMATLCIVFSRLMQTPVGDYAVFLFAGLIPWGFLSGTVNECSTCIVNNENLIRKIYLPKTVFVLSRLLINVVTLLLSMVAMFLLLIPLGARPSWAMLALPLVILIFAVFVLGLGLLVAVLNTFFRDVGHMMGVFLQAWYFLTPILYKLDQLDAQSRFWFTFNPAYPFIQSFQIIIYQGAWPQLSLAWSVAIAFPTLVLGYTAFKRHEDKMIFRL